MNIDVVETNGPNIASRSARNSNAILVTKTSDQKIKELGTNDGMDTLSVPRKDAETLGTLRTLGPLITKFKLRNAENAIRVCYRMIL